MNGRVELLEAIQKVYWDLEAPLQYRNLRDRHRIERKCFKYGIVPEDLKTWNRYALARSVYNLLDADEKGHQVGQSIGMPLADKKVSYTNAQGVRMRLKFNRYLTRQLGFEETRSDHIEWFVREVFNKLDDVALIDERIEFVSGRELRQAFKNCFGGSSCMTGSRSDYCLQLYSENPGKIKLAKYETKEGFCARFLVWFLDGKTLVDRIYPNDGAHIPAIHAWCEWKGYAYRVRQGHPCSNSAVELSNGESYTVTLKAPSNGKFPYIDSFHFGEVRGDSVRLSTCPEESFVEAIFACTEGGYDASGGECVGCYERISGEVYTHDGDRYCEGCYDNRFGYCAGCDETTPSEDLTYVNRLERNLCSNCLSDDYTECDICGEYEHNGDIRRNVNGDDTCETCAEQNHLSCEECDELVPESEVMNSDHDCRDRCESCNTNHEEEIEREQNEECEVA